MKMIGRMPFIFFILAGISSWSVMSRQLLQKKEVKLLIKKNKEGYVGYLISLSKKWYWYQAFGSIAQFGARVKYTKDELRYAVAAGPFFDNFDSKVRLKKIAVEVGSQQDDIDYLHDLINYYKEQGSEDISKVLHKKNLEDLLLPKYVTPEKLVLFVNTGQVNMQRYCKNVALNIFVKYLVDEKLLP